MTGLALGARAVANGGKTDWLRRYAWLEAGACVASLPPGGFIACLYRCCAII